MKFVKNLAAIILTCVMVLSVVGCHKKNEIAVTVNGYEYTSAYYMCAFLHAYEEAVGIVNEQLGSDSQLTTATQKIDYTAQKIDDKKFETWVKDRAIEIIKENTFCKSLADKNKLKLTAEQKQNAEAQANTMWSYMSEYYEENGVYQKTYKQYILDSAYSAAYFEHLYGEGGEKEIAKKDVKKELYDNYMLVNILEVNFEDYEATDERGKEIEKKLKAYVKKLKAEKMTFEEVWDDYYEISKEDKKKAEEEAAATEDKDAPKPKDKYATLVSKTGNYATDYYDEIKELKTGTVKLLENKYGSGYALVIKQDIKKDDYYLETMDMSIRYSLKNDEYLKYVDKESKALKADINKYAVNQFKVKKIVEPEVQQ